MQNKESKALAAIVARINGPWDDPHLAEFGPLSADALEDVLRIAESAI